MPVSGLILHGDQDVSVPPESVQKLVHKLSHQRDIKIEFRKIPGADHFFADNAEALAAMSTPISARMPVSPSRRRAAAAPVRGR